MNNNYRRFKSIAYQVDIARQMETPQTLKEIIDFGASVGYNELFLYGEGSLEYLSYPECSVPWALKQQEFKELQHYAAQYNMQLVPVIPIFGHTNYILKNQNMVALREIQSGQTALINENAHQFCTSNPKSFELIEAMLIEWMQLSDTPLIHVGGDESWNFAQCPLCQADAEQLGRGKALANYFNRINTIIKKHNKQMMIWHDMLFYYDDCLPHLDKDIIICDWHYETIERHPGVSIYNWVKTDFLKAYEAEQFPVYICPKAKCNYTAESNNINSFLSYSNGSKAIGFLNTVWEMETMPYAAAYPALAYGAACCRQKRLPDPRLFLHEFIATHFSAGQEVLPLLIDLFGEVAELEIFAGMEGWINYQNPTLDIVLAGKLDEAVKLIKQVKGKTVPGKAYHEALKLIFKRMAIVKRLQGLVGEIAQVFLPSQLLDKTAISEKLTQLSTLLNALPVQTADEQCIWDKYRPVMQDNPVVEQLNTAQASLRQFVTDIGAVFSGELQPVEVLAPVLELTMINNDCSWQILTLSGSQDDKQYAAISESPQCAPFGRYVKTFAIKEQFKFIKIELSGFGELLLNFARIVGPDAILNPLSIKTASGNVVNSEHFLIDDLRPTIMGCVDAKKYFTQGKGQPKSTIVLEMGCPDR
jgi:glycosyl hydrolase family 20